MTRCVFGLQFVYYLRDLAGGDFGTSISMRHG